MALPPGTRLGPYEVRTSLGAGGMGEVYRARDNRLGREVRVEVLPETIATNERALARFEREAKAGAALSHPGILTLYDIGEASGVRFAVTELLEGETLRAVAARGALGLRRSLEIAVQLAEALAAAHEEWIVHRDVKPKKALPLRSASPSAVPRNQWSGRRESGPGEIAGAAQNLIATPPMA